MSFNTYGGQTTGLVIRSEQIRPFIEKYIELNPDEFAKDISMNEKIDTVDELLMCNEEFKNSSGEGGFYVQAYTDDNYYNTAAMYSLCDTNDWHESLDMPFVLVEADKALLTKYVLEGKYYKNKEELVQEFKDKLGKYLPEDFDYESSIGDVEYAISC